MRIKATTSSPTTRSAPMLPRLWHFNKCMRPAKFRQRHFSSNAETVQVYVLDPKILFSNSPSDQINNSQQDWRSSNAAAPYVQVSLPRAFLPNLSDGQFQLGEMDDPGNSWVFGEEGELFEQKLLGSHKAQCPTSDYNILLMESLTTDCPIDFCTVIALVGCPAR
ncbi:hypothetical protein WJX79_006824 [Trebouxia sp. C0005]